MQNLKSKYDQHLDQHLGLRLDAADIRALSYLAKRAGLSKSRYCRLMLRKHMAKEFKKDSKDSFNLLTSV